jgi:hypothetical protein
MRRKWGVEEDKEARAMYAAGEPVDKIAAKFGRTCIAISNHCAGVRRVVQWTEHMTQEMRGMAAQGLTSPVIAERLGVSKNSVVGRCYRMGISLGPGGGGPTAQRRRRKKVSQALPAPAPVENPTPAPVRRQVAEPSDKFTGRDVRYLSKLAASLVQARHDQCRFPQGDGFCRETAAAGSSWCEKHKVICFTQMRK